jgi:all-trans-retinol dehydrogenase (NAD+)
MMSVSKVSPLRLLTAPVRLALFDPRVTAPLLIAILYYPEKLQSLLTTRLHPLISSPAFITTLKIALGLSLVRGINKKLSQWVVNNWKSDANFAKSQEIVMISGGTSGIGKLMAEYFAKQGVKTVVLDINAPKEPLRK